VPWIFDTTFLHFGLSFASLGWRHLFDLALASAVVNPRGDLRGLLNRAERSAVSAREQQRGDDGGLAILRRENRGEAGSLQRARFTAPLPLGRLRQERSE
jgi:hypothetical protein